MENNLVENAEYEIGSINIGFYGRVVTYEGPESMSLEEEVSSSAVIKDVQESIDSIVTHLCQQDIFLQSANFYFKYSKDELYLLFATNIKTKPSNNTELAMDREVFLKIPDEIDLHSNFTHNPQSKSLFRPIGPKDVRVPPISAKPDASYRSLVSQKRVKQYCPF